MSDFAGLLLLSVAAALPVPEGCAKRPALRCEAGR